MPERIGESIQYLETQRDNAAFLEGAIPALSRSLLFLNLIPDDEAAGYKFIRSFNTHPDERVRELANNAIENRWQKAGFYTQHEPNLMLRERSRPWYEEKERLSDQCQIAILEMANNFVPGQTVSANTLQRMLFPLLGPDTDTQNIIRNLKELNILTAEGEYVSVVNLEKDKIQLNEVAYQNLAHHLPALNAASYPEYVIPAEDIQTLKKVRRSLRQVDKRSYNRWQKADMNRLRVTEDDQLLTPSFWWMEYALSANNDLQRKDGVVLISADYDNIRVHHRQKAELGDYSEKSMTVEFSNSPYQTDDGVLYNPWGQVIRGQQSGSMTFQQSSIGAYRIEASGNAKPPLSPQLDRAESVSVTEEQLDINLALEGHSGSLMNATIVYATPYKQDSRFSGEVGVATHISNKPFAIQVPVASGNERGYTKHELVILEGNSGTRQLQHPDGDYVVHYQDNGDVIDVTVVGDQFQNTLQVPKNVDTANVAHFIEGVFADVTTRMIENRADIEEQMANAKRLGFAERYILLRQPKRLNNKYLTRLRALDAAIAGLTEKQQWAVRNYIRLLSEGAEDTTDPKERMRALNDKCALDIPNSVLKQCESAFLQK